MEMAARSAMRLLLALCLALCVQQTVGGHYGWRSGHCTYYGSANGGGTMGGACGYGNLYAQGYGVNTAALSTPLFQGGSTCGACYQLKCNHPRWCHPGQHYITITATNLCPPGSTGGWCDPPREHFDLPMPMFNSLAQEVAGVVPVYYRRVACKKFGGARFLIEGNPYFMMILIYNVGGAGDVRAVNIRGSRTGYWIRMDRNWGAIWTCRTKLTGEALSFQLFASDGRVLTSYNVADAWWGFGQTFEGLSSVMKRKLVGSEFSLKLAELASKIRVVHWANFCLDKLAYTFSKALESVLPMLANPQAGSIVDEFVIGGEDLLATRSYKEIAIHDFPIIERLIAAEV